nr:hypothetical protein [Luteibacter rhizovicinus]
MQRSGGPDIRVKYFDVPPLDPTADLRRTEPMRAVLEPEPGGNWTDVFYELLGTADSLVIRAHPVIDDGAIVFAPTVEEANGTCILLKRLVMDVNTVYRSRGVGSAEDMEARRKHREALAALDETLNRTGG